MPKLLRYLLLLLFCFTLTKTVNAELPPGSFDDSNNASPNIMQGIIVSDFVLGNRDVHQYYEDVQVQKKVWNVKVTAVDKTTNNIEIGDIIEVEYLAYYVPDDFDIIGGTDTWIYSILDEKKNFIYGKLVWSFYLDAKNENGRYVLVNNGRGRFSVEPDNPFKNNEGSQVTPHIIKNTNSTSFTDVSEGNSSYEAIQYMKENGIISGYSDGTFRPNNTINRAEFLKILIEAKFEENEIENCIAQNSQPNWTYLFFYDVKPNDWFAKYVCVAKVKNIVGGYPDGTFQANNKVTFAEVAKIVVNTFGLGYQVQSAVWYEPFVQILSDRKVIPTSILVLEQKIARSEVAEIIWRIKNNKTNKASKLYEETSLCIPAGQGYYEPHLQVEKCCNNILAMPISVFSVMPNGESGCMNIGGTVCLPCGNGICESEYGENFCNCSEDCEKE